ncbi:FAD linked oxidase domain-containing protein [Cupriavidus basilensis OR16]|uniref:FAD linked oxidase domain-containing protein n=1 Tax=Cupriavidus basilensis OR16 TaxID=1127483 RepID=H1S9D0_9BURK|nr:FAD-binding oxidoreductase [Cupriavidus basilensis]EHP40854.1 FAD linked oxidase domain-containing protein [Cupriavidus basilensis OR16]
MTDATLAGLRSQFAGRLLTTAEDTAPFLTDWRRSRTGRALAVAQPDSTADVAAIVRWCAAHQVPLVPQGGNTGMVGGAIPDDGGRALVLSTARLNRIREIDPLNNTLTAEAGCILAAVQQAAQDAGRLYPLSLGAEGSCTIGGNLASNAGGVQVLRYGNTRELCLGLEVVTPDGELWDGLRGLRKDNTGYDLKQLFIGAEGTLGVITAATLKLFPRPAARMTALAAVSDPQAALRLLELAQRRLAATLTAFELMSDVCVALVARHFPDCRTPFEQAHPWYVLLESSDPHGEARATQAFGELMEEAFEAGIVADAAIAASLAQSDGLWRIRHHLPDAQSLEGDNLKHDISVPISAIAEFIAHTGAAIVAANPGARVIAFGHLGDGNLHYNVSAPYGVAQPDFVRANGAAIGALVYEAVHRVRGSISAEHGIGQLKVEKNAHYKSAVEMALMQKIKQALDPRGLMNPGRLLPGASR